MTEMRRLAGSGERRFAQALVGEAADLRDLVGANAVGLHDAAGGVGAVPGELPVAVGRGRSVGLGVGVAFDGELLGSCRVPGRG